MNRAAAPSKIALLPESPPVLGSAPGALVAVAAAVPTGALVAALVAAAVVALVAAAVAASVAALVAAAVAPTVAVPWSSGAAMLPAPTLGTSMRLKTRMAAIIVPINAIFRMRSSLVLLCGIHYEL